MLLNLTRMKYLRLCLFFVMLTLTGSADITTSCNTEKHFSMEEELISISKLIIGEEQRRHGKDEDVHGIYNLISIVDKIKNIHIDIGMSQGKIEAYMNHPINAFHMVKRLVRIWKKVVQKLLESSTCHKLLAVKLQNIEDNIPTEAEMYSVAYNLLALQTIHGYSIPEVMVGNVSGSVPYERMTLNDALDICHAADEHGELALAINWMNFIAENVSTGIPEDFPFKIGGVYTRLASLYSMSGRTGKALEITDRLLQIDPKNTNAMNNMEYYSQRAGERNQSEESGDVKRKVTKKQRMYEDVCSGRTIKATVHNPRYKCLLLNRWNASSPFRKPSEKLEIISLKPFVAVLYDCVGPDVTEAVEYIARQAVVTPRVENGYKPMISSFLLGGHYADQWFRKYIDNITDIRFSIGKTVLDDHIEVHNVGMGGFRGDRLRKSQYANGGLAHIHLFLSEKTLGGEIIFPTIRKKVDVQRGAVVMYEKGLFMDICPVMYGSQWYTSSGVWKGNSTYSDYRQRLFITS